MKRLILLVFLLLLIVVIGGAPYVRQQLQIPGPLQPGAGLILEIPRGLGARAVVGLLEDKKVIGNRYMALVYLFYTLKYNRLQAGEYLFDGPMTIPEVVDKLTSGAVYLHRFTVPEGLTANTIAQKWHQEGLGTAQEFLNAVGVSVDLVRHIDDKAMSVEGYLFPETYSFPSHTTPSQVINGMVTRFRDAVERLKQTVPLDNWPLNLHDTIILASIVESEAAHEDERPLIASVYLNRLKRNMLLQCDPTVIYALVQADKYRGVLTLADLRFRSPYNTYVTSGLPPGPISNPGYPSLLASIQPANTKYLYFVRTVEGRHTFSETLAAHNQAVAAYRKSVRRAGRD